MLSFLQKKKWQNLFLERLEAPGALDNVPFAKNKVKMLEIAIEKSCPIINMPLKKLSEKFPNFKANIVGLVRKEKFQFLKKRTN